MNLVKSLRLAFTLLPSIVTAFHKTKFVEWFHPFDIELSPSWKNGSCHTLYYDYVNEHRGVCGAVLNCILENTNELEKTTIASAQVVLGLTPSLLSSIGSSVAELSLLGSQRPLLSFLLVIGAPTHYPTRIFEFTKPTDIVFPVPGSIGTDWVGSSMRILVGLVQYLLAGAAAANNIELALRIGSRSILAWGCNSWYMPLFWIFFSTSTLVVAVCSGRIMIYAEDEEISSTVAQVGRAEEPRKLSYSLLNFESGPAFANRKIIMQQECPSATAIFLQIFASCLAFLPELLDRRLLAE
ncbi:MAG: hypothetical protein Q9190_007320 [Brigantiaea leucoxantha]